MLGKPEAPYEVLIAWELRRESGLVREGPLGFLSLLAASQDTWLCTCGGSRPG